MSQDDGPTAPVLLIYMPFGSVIRPAIGISQFKAILKQRGIACDIRYLNILFAEHIGMAHYDQIGSSGLHRFLFGERLFVPALYGADWRSEQDQFDELETELADAGILPNFAELLMDVLESVETYLDACMAAVDWEQYKIIGFSSTYEQNVASLALARRVKAAWPDKIIVFGGGNCEGQMGVELHRQFSFIDFVCCGEGDDLFPRLVEALLADQKVPFIPGLVARRAGETVAMGMGTVPISDMDSLPYPDYDDYLRQLEESSLDVAGSVALLFETSRGCWYGAKQHCTFCGFNGDAMVFRSKTPGRVRAELEYLTRRYGIKALFATDNILDMQYLRDVIPELAGSDPDWSIFYEVKANLSKDQLRLLKKAGIDQLQPGIESLSTSVLTLMRKGCTALQNIQLLKWASELGLNLIWNIITSFPKEDPDAYARMADMIPALLHLRPPNGVGPVRLDRFSPFYSDPKSLGMENVRPAAAYHKVYPFPEDSLRRLAYFFDFDYADGRNPRSYTRQVEEIVDYWRGHYAPEALTYYANETEVIIHDWRPGANQSEFVLEGAAKAAYEFCDEAHAMIAIHKHVNGIGYAIDEPDLLALLEELVAARLMLRDDNWFLSLAVPIGSVVQPASDSLLIQKALAGAFVEMADVSRKRRQAPTPAAAQPLRTEVTH